MPHQPENNSNSFDLLDRSIQHWIWNEKWDQLRDIQEETIPIIISGKHDLIVASATASGKTEAAFLPILSNCIKQTSKGVYAIYIAPLKALITDQTSRLERITKYADVKITPWHGDVSQNKKSSLIKNPNGILLITPESLESIFINHGTKLKYLFNNLSYIIIDEMHSFIGVERGKQLSSLLDRLEIALAKRTIRIGLSATLGDKSLAKQFLRKNYDVQNIKYVESKAFNSSLKLHLKGYISKKPDLKSGSLELPPSHRITEHLFRNLRGTDNLIFANSRSNVELYADLLRQKCEEEKVPLEFYPHHGNLSKNFREHVENELKNKSKPSSAVCTTTLEMGIDIGTVKSIAQIGCPPSVASMRQRLGRSGRRGEPSILRLYQIETEIDKQTSLQDKLRAGIVQSIAMTELMLKKWVEPPSLNNLHLSTFVQQILSVIAQYGSLRANELWHILIENGVFGGISKKDFKELLISLGDDEIIVQQSDKTLTLGVKGESIVGHYSFYAVFKTPEEYTIIANGKNLGSLPVEFPLIEGSFIIFGGNRWVIKSIDDEKKIIELIRSKGGTPPLFNGGGFLIDDHIREKMYQVYMENSIPIYLDSTASELLQEGRKYFNFYNLSTSAVIEDSNSILLFPWKGSSIMNTIQLLLIMNEFEATNEGIAISIKGITLIEFKMVLNQISQTKENEFFMFLDKVKNKEIEKYDHLLTDRLLTLNYKSRSVNLVNTIDFLKQITLIES